MTDEQKLALAKKLKEEADARQAWIDDQVKKGLWESRPYLCTCGCGVKLGDLRFPTGHPETEWTRALSGLWNDPCNQKMLAALSEAERVQLEVDKAAANAAMEAKFKAFLEAQGLTPDVISKMLGK